MTDSPISESSTTTEVREHLIDLEKRRQGITITTGNLKGGISKTTTNVLVAYLLAKRGIKTLVLDMDPQGNATRTLRLTQAVNDGTDIPEPIERTVMESIIEGDFEPAVMPIMENLDLLPAREDLKFFAKYMYRIFDNEEQEDFIIRNLLAPLKEKYDIILIDTPPFSMEVTNNAISASDYAFIPLQTQDYSLAGAETYFKDLTHLNETHELGLLLLGIVPVLMRKQGTIDIHILEKAKEIFGEEIIFDTVITQMERIKQFAGHGITENPPHDTYVLEHYTKFTNEFVDRINKLERFKDGREELADNG